MMGISKTACLIKFCSRHLFSNQYHKKVNVTPRFKYAENQQLSRKAESNSEQYGHSAQDQPMNTFVEQGEIKPTTNFLSGDLLELEDNFPKKKFDKSSNFQKTDSFKRRKFYKPHNPNIEINGEILFGIHPVLLALRANRRNFYKLLLKEKVSGLNDRLEEIKRLANEIQIPISYVSKYTLNTLTGDRPHQSICLDVSKLETPFYDSTTINNKSHSALPVWLLLYEIHDPMNLGAILRSAYFMGVEKVFTVENYSCPLTPIVSKASSGAMEVTDFFKIRKLEEFLQAKRNDGWEILGTMTENRRPTQLETNVPIDVCNYKLNKPTIIVVGNEGEGLNSKVLRFCSNFLTILPGCQATEEISSLNVSVATGIILHTLLKNRQGQRSVNDSSYEDSLTEK